MIDIDLLPSRPLLDTGVLIRALRQRIDGRSQVCVELFDALLMNGSTVLISALSIAEMVRNDPGKGMPNVGGVEVVAFDGPTALILGQKLGHKWIGELSRSSGLPRDYLRYDSIIAASAIRHRADQLIAIDGDYVSLAKALVLPLTEPEDYLKTQQDIPFGGPRP